MHRQRVYQHLGFQKLSERLISEYLRRNPVSATWVGDHRYDDLLPETGAEAAEKDCEWFLQQRSAWESLPERELSLDERLDRRLVLYFLQNELFLNADVRRWRLGADLARTIGDSLFPLFVREFAPWHERVERMISRLKAAPAFLASGRTLFQAVPPLFVEIYIESAERLPELFKAIEKTIDKMVPAFLTNEFKKVAREAEKALGAHAHWLRQAIAPKAAGDWALGPSGFQGLLTVRQLGLAPNDLRDLGESALCRAHEKVKAMSRHLVGAPNRDEALQKIQKKAPRSFKQALDAYRDSSARCRAFVEISGFASLPGDETLEIMETPGYMAHLIPFAAYIPSERSARPQKGIYVVTRGKSGDLGRYNYPDIANTTVHEGYPGHHLQLTGQNQHPSFLRTLINAMEMCEGWAHYCEEEVKRLGFENSPENLLVQGVDEAWRASRVLIDVNLHYKTWSHERALQCLLENTTMDRESALGELRWYVQSPGYPLSYLTGKHLLFQLKDSLKAKFGNDFQDRVFHDLVIFEGAIPISLAREFYPLMLKEELRCQPHQVLSIGN